MQAEAHVRARQGLSVHQGKTAAVHLLGIVHSLILLTLLTVFGLLAALIISAGEARFPTESLNRLPNWTPAKSGTDGPDTLFDDTGLLPVITSNLDSEYPVHRLGGNLILRLVSAVPPLQNNLGALTTLLAVALTLLLIHNLLTQYRRGLIADLVSGVALNLRRQIHRQMYRLGQSSLPTEGTGPVINLFTREVNDVGTGLFKELDRRWRTPVLMAGLIVLALSLSPILALFLSSLAILTWYVSRGADRSARAAGDAAIRDAAVDLSMLHEDLGMLRTVRVYEMEKVDNERFDQHLEQFREAEIRRYKSESQLNPNTWLVYGIAASLAAGILGYSVLASKQLSPASALLLVTALAALIPPILGWRNLRRAIRQSSRSAAGIFEFLDRSPELHQQGGAHFLDPIREQIRFRAVTLKSRSGDLLLDEVGIEIPAGSKTAIMGVSEDSKHALVCLIPRLIDPTAGRVLIDGKDLREVTLESIREQVATVLQADLCFTDSVLMNIGLGNPNYDKPRIIEAAKVAHAHNFIQDLPDGYETVIGPVGHYLKVDELYRIALARAYLHDPSILIIEEPDITLDDDTKHMIDDAVARLSRNRTVIVLPHRLSTIRSCQQIILLHNGKVDAVGTAKQLESDSKLFRYIWQMEFNPFSNHSHEPSAS